MLYSENAGVRFAVQPWLRKILDDAGATEPRVQGAFGQHLRMPLMWREVDPLKYPY